MVKIGKTIEDTRDEKTCPIDHPESCHWIIIKDDGSKVFGYPHETKEDAKAELSFKNLSGYHIEHKTDQRYLAEKK